MPDLTLFHTAEVHVETFRRLAPEADLCQQVRADWLAQAQGGISPELAQVIAETIQAASGPVLCTCTTLGEVAEQAGATRLDWPMMQEAARIGGPILLTYCLESTAQPSTTLLQRAFDQADTKAEIHPLALPHLWQHFESGETELFAQGIAEAIIEELERAPAPACVVLAQASMAGAAEILQEQTDVPALTSPAIAMKQLLGK